MPTSKRIDDEEERPECDSIDDTPVTPASNPRDGRREPCEEDGGEGAPLLGVEGGPDTTPGGVHRGRCSSSLTGRTGRPRLSTSESSPTFTRERDKSLGSGENVGTKTGRKDSRGGVGGGGGRRTKKRGRVDGCKEKRPFFSPSPLQLQPSWTSGPPPVLSQSLTDAHSIYSSIGGPGAGASRPKSFGVITGPFTSRQESFRDRHLRPRTADGSTSPTRSGVWIFVTTRSNFDSSLQQQQQQQQGAAGSSGSRHHGGRRRRNCAPARLDRRGVVNDRTNAPGRSGAGHAGNLTSFRSLSSGHQLSSPQQDQQPEAESLDETKAPLFGEESSLWACDLSRPSASGVREKRPRALATARGSRRVGSDSSSNLSEGLSHRNACRDRAPKGAAAPGRTGFVASMRGGVARPVERILSPEGASARLASIRKVYGPEGVRPFLPGGLHASSHHR